MRTSEKDFSAYNVNFVQQIRYLAFPAIFWYGCHGRSETESMVAFITGVTYKHLIIITRMSE